MIAIIALVFCLALSVDATVASIGYILYTLWQIPCNYLFRNNFVEFVVIPIVYCILTGAIGVMLTGICLGYMGVI